MAPKKAQASAKKDVPMWDLDNPASFVADIGTEEASGSVGQKRKKKKQKKDLESGFPPAEYTRYAEDACLAWYEETQAQFLEHNYLKNASMGGERLKEKLETIITEAMARSEEYKDCDYHSEYPTWLGNTIQQCTFNVKELLKRRFAGKELTPADEQFRQKMDWWQVSVSKLSKSKTRGMAWQKDALMATFERDTGSGVVWIPQEATIEPLSARDMQGGHGLVRKVRIVGVDHVPNHVPFAAKLSKDTDMYKRRLETSAEALVCPLNHPGIIKFWALHTTTFEAYTYWWNGGSLHEMLKLDDKVGDKHLHWSKVKDISGLTEEEVQKISLFRRHRMKLAWGLVYIMNLVHKVGVLHNDLSPTNILLHFPAVPSDKICIGVCDWGMASRIQERRPSRYGYPTKEKMEREIKARWWVAPEIFYTFGPEKSDTNLNIQEVLHPTTVESDSYGVGKLIQMINVHKEFDEELFPTTMARESFLSKVLHLTLADPKKRMTCGKVVNVLMGKPYNMLPPDFVFREDLS
jgi:serine/threonine protein kinase